MVGCVGAQPGETDLEALDIGVALPVEFGFDSAGGCAGHGCMGLPMQDARSTLLRKGGGHENQGDGKKQGGFHVFYVQQRRKPRKPYFCWPCGLSDVAAVVFVFGVVTGVLPGEVNFVFLGVSFVEILRGDLEDLRDGDEKM